MESSLPFELRDHELTELGRDIYHYISENSPLGTPLSADELDAFQLGDFVQSSLYEMLGINIDE